LAALYGAHLFQRRPLFSKAAALPLWQCGQFKSSHIASKVGIFPQWWQLFLNGSQFASKAAAFFNEAHFVSEAMWLV
jgi:hypothetical protein